MWDGSHQWLANQVVSGPVNHPSCLGGCAIAEHEARSAVELNGDLTQVAETVFGQVYGFRKVLPQKPVGVLVGAALPGCVRVAELDPEAGQHLDVPVQREVAALIPR
jgi:hypothetical protein